MLNKKKIDKINKMTNYCLLREGITKITSEENSSFQKGYAKGVLMMRKLIKENWDQF